MAKTLKVKRKELKHHISKFQYTSLAANLSHILVEDKNNKEAGYKVRSLYFDTYANTDYYQKLAGSKNRKKIRLRIYNHDDKMVKLEIKRKYNDSQEKQTVVISREDAQALIDLNYDVLLKYKSDTAMTIYNIMKTNHLRPVVLIEYRRKAFIHKMNNIRITLDSDIRANESKFDFFEKDPVLMPTSFYYEAVLEVKFNNFIYKWITDVFKQYDLERQSFSKYNSSRKLFESYMG